VDKIEKSVDGGGSRKVSNVNSTTSSSVGDTKSDLEGSGRILDLFVDRVLGRKTDCSSI
jgi:hypothetical protein